MAEMFFSYISTFLDFVVKVAIVAFVALQFGYINAPKAAQSEDSNSDSKGANNRRGNSNANGNKQEQPLGDLFKGIMSQMAPMLSQINKPPQEGGRTALNFSDEPNETPAVTSEDNPILPVN